MALPSILDRIIQRKWQEIASAKERVSLDLLRQRLDTYPVRSFHSAVSDPAGLRLIAEVKKASPSKGVLRADFDPVEIARQYEAGGAHAISVLTDVDFFQGSLDYLSQIRRSVSLPLLRKDFILDPYQVYEARVAGADAILLIAECLTAARLKELQELARSLGMDALVELYDEEHLPAVLDSGTSMVGVNNRDLRTFQVDFDRTLSLRSRIPMDRCMVGESGISGSKDAQKLWEGGVQAILVGETLMKQADLARAVRELLDFSS